MVLYVLLDFKGGKYIKLFVLVFVLYRGISWVLGMLCDVGLEIVVRFLRLGF